MGDREPPLRTDDHCEANRDHDYTANSPRRSVEIGQLELPLCECYRSASLIRQNEASELPLHCPYQGGLHRMTLFNAEHRDLRTYATLTIVP